MLFLAGLVLLFSTVQCGKPSLSDPLGLLDEGLFEFKTGADYVFGTIWPKPQQEARENVYYTLDPHHFTFKTTGKSSDVLSDALSRYLPVTFPDEDVKPDPQLTQMTSLEVNVLQDIKPMDLNTDESCKDVIFILLPSGQQLVHGSSKDARTMFTADFKQDTLVVGAPTSSLSANTVWGVLRGLETFSQVVFQNETGFYHAQKNKVVDFPRFNHRGLLIDTSRHFVAIDVILQFIDALAYSKYNVLHWHIVDNQGFPFVSKTYPSLYLKDALAYSKYNVLHWHIVDDQGFPFVSKTYPSLNSEGAVNNVTHIYTPEDVQDVIAYARFRGIRVLPEFDTPGHTQSWGSIPNLLTPCYSGGKPNGNFGPIDPTVEGNYAFLEKFFHEVATVFPDKYIHLGGDEVNFDCWKSNPNIAKWMADHEMAKNYSLLEQYYEQRLLNIVGDLGKNYVIWQEVIDNHVKVKNDTVVNVWIGGWQKEMAKVTGLGYNAILSSPWYLNYISYGPDWPKYYKVDPQAFTGTEEQKKKVIGGTACMWGEWVDGANLIPRTWGRALSVGERLWSSKDTTDVTDATKRIWEHRCRYLRRGIQAENVVQSKYCRHEWMNKK